jgi:hypothetical protein
MPDGVGVPYETQVLEESDYSECSCAGNIHAVSSTPLRNANSRCKFTLNPGGAWTTVPRGRVRRGRAQRRVAGCHARHASPTPRDRRRSRDRHDRPSRFAPARETPTEAPVNESEIRSAASRRADGSRGQVGREGRGLAFCCEECLLARCSGTGTIPAHHHEADHPGGRGRATTTGGRLARASEPPQAAGLDQIDEEVPFLLAEDGRVGVLADPDLVAVDDDLRAMIAGRAVRDSARSHRTSPSFHSMWGRRPSECSGSVPRPSAWRGLPKGPPPAPGLCFRGAVARGRTGPIHSVVG